MRLTGHSRSFDGDSDALALPRLAPTVSFESSAGEGAPLIVSVSGVPASRVSVDVVHLLRAMDGRTTLPDLRARFAPQTTDEEFRDLLTRFRASGLLEGTRQRTAGVLTYRPPLTVQLATLRAPAVFAALDRRLARLRGAWLSVVAACTLAIGLVAMLWQAGSIWLVLSSPVPWQSFLAVAVTMTVATLAHEVAHGATLTRFGQTPRRAGVMLLYLSPAFFVDVTNGWRLPHPRSRVIVALAGPAVHAVLGAVAFSVAAVVSGEITRTSLLMLGAACIAVVVINLIPFVRFDGYLALMSWLDEPGLRTRTILDARDRLRRMLVGGANTPRRLDRWWSVPFGIASCATPLVLIAYALTRIVRGLSGGGVVGALIIVAVECAVAVAVVVLAVMAVRHAVGSGANLLRVAAVGIALVAAVASAGTLVRQPVIVQAGFVATQTGVDVVMPATAENEVLVDGLPVELSTAGLFVNVPLVATTFTREDARTVSVPLSALFPVEAADASIPAVRVGSADITNPGTAAIPSTGVARVTVGTENLWEGVWRSLIADPVRTLLTQETTEWNRQ
ncbi:MAG: daptide biosynthesis intramembrane metalloprotease [Actinomycetota bacterium]